MKLVFAALSLVAIVGAATAAFADDGTMSIQDNAATPGKWNVKAEAASAASQLRVDGANSTQVDARRFGISTSAAAVKPVQFGFGVTSLTRDIEDKRAGYDTEKRTQIFAPALGLNVAEQGLVTIGYTIYQTRIDQPFLDQQYELNTARTTLAGQWTTPQDTASVGVSTEARAEKTFDVQAKPVVERDYIPLQVDAGYARHLNQRWTVDGGIRYSQYDEDVYKDTYDTVVPKKPTVGQVFDYLVSLKAGATCIVSEKVAVRADVGRKAALDTNSYDGDEYVVGATAGLTVTTQISDGASLALGYKADQGKKTHVVQGKSYAYADRRNEVSLAIGAAL